MKNWECSDEKEMLCGGNKELLKLVQWQRSYETVQVKELKYKSKYFLCFSYQLIGGWTEDMKLNMHAI